jgi:hypothetical protein
MLRIEEEWALFFEHVLRHDQAARSFSSCKYPFSTLTFRTALLRGCTKNDTFKVYIIRLALSIAYGAGSASISSICPRAKQPASDE